MFTLGPTDFEKRILVIDDEPTIRELIADALGESGFLLFGKLPWDERYGDRRSSWNSDP